MPPLRIYIVDDNKEFNKILKHMLDSIPEIEVVGKALNGITAVQEVCDLKPDVVLMDISMPDITGIEAMRRIKMDDAGQLVFILTMHDNNVYRKASFSAGADGFFVKTECQTRLIQALQRISTVHIDDIHTCLF